MRPGGTLTLSSPGVLGWLLSDPALLEVTLTADGIAKLTAGGEGRGQLVLLDSEGNRTELSVQVSSEPLEMLRGTSGRLRAPGSRCAADGAALATAALGPGVLQLKARHEGVATVRCSSGKENAFELALRVSSVVELSPDERIGQGAPGQARALSPPKRSTAPDGPIPARGSYRGLRLRKGESRVVHLPGIARFAAGVGCNCLDLKPFGTEALLVVALQNGGKQTLLAWLRDGRRTAIPLEVVE